MGNQDIKSGVEGIGVHIERTSRFESKQFGHSKDF
jgi:hypothetical protein